MSLMPAAPAVSKITDFEYTLFRGGGRRAKFHPFVSGYEASQQPSS